MPDASVVVGDFSGEASRTADSVRAAATAAGVEVELIVVGHGHEPACAADRVLGTLPLGAAYVRNRGLALATAPVVAFVDAGLEVEAGWLDALLGELRGGRAAAVAGPCSRRLRRWPRLRGRAALASPLWLCGPANAVFVRERLLAHGGFAQGSVHGGEAEVFVRFARAGESLAWSPRAAAFGTRTAAGRKAASPAELLTGMPPSLAAALPDEPKPFERSHPAKTHLSYTVGRELMLHLHGNPSARLERAAREREDIRRRAPGGGIPRLVDAAPAPDALWLLEERLPGRPPDTRAPEGWFAVAADWAVGMAGPPGRRLADVPTWLEHREALLAFAPAAAVERVERALTAVSELRAVHMHGDLQPRNLLVDGAAVGAVDWEGAWLEGVPGLDLVFLALFAAGAGPDVGVLERLARGEEVPQRGLLPRLRRLGVEAELLPDLVVALLAVWALSENRRLTRLGAPPRPPVFAPLLGRFSAET